MIQRNKRVTWKDRNSGERVECRKTPYEGVQSTVTIRYGSGKHSGKHGSAILTAQLPSAKVEVTYPPLAVSTDFLNLGTANPLIL